MYQQTHISNVVSCRNKIDKKQDKSVQESSLGLKVAKGSSPTGVLWRGTTPPGGGTGKVNPSLGRERGIESRGCL